MTREEEIRRFALERNHEGDFDRNNGYLGIIEGAQWADEHPKNPWRNIYEEQPDLIHKHKKGCFAGFVDSDPVLVRYKTESGRYFIKQAVFSKYKNEEPMFYGVEDVTHWMPIPEL